MLYTVKEVSELTGVTVKALHHYHKIGLLLPCQIRDSGYRLYGTAELEQLQQILFYRELDFSLKDIKKAMENEPHRLECLTRQQKLLVDRKDRIDCLLKTIQNSIVHAKKGEAMNQSEMFQGLNKEEWENALTEQNEYLKDKYSYDMLQDKELDIPKINEQAAEAQAFMNAMKEALLNGQKVTDTNLHKVIEDHLTFLNHNGTTIDHKSFVIQTKFFLGDDFHRSMLEDQQIGLSYYLYAAALAYEENH